MQVLSTNFRLAYDSIMFAQEGLALVYFSPQNSFVLVTSSVFDVEEQVTFGDITIKNRI